MRERKKDNGTTKVYRGVSIGRGSSQNEQRLKETGGWREGGG